MKRTILIATAMLTFFVIKAQVSQGNMILGGAASFSTQSITSEFGGSSSSTSKYASFGLYPEFSYFIMDNLAVGPILGFGLGKSSADPDYTSTSTSLTLGVTGRYYISDFFIDGAVSLGSYETKDDFGGSTTKTKDGLTDFYVGGGYVFFLSETVGLEPLLLYGWSKIQDDDNADISTTSSGIGFRIGLNFYFIR